MRLPISAVYVGETVQEVKEAAGKRKLRRTEFNRRLASVSGMRTRKWPSEHSSIQRDKERKREKKGEGERNNARAWNSVAATGAE